MIPVIPRAFRSGGLVLLLAVAFGACGRSSMVLGRYESSGQGGGASGGGGAGGDGAGGTGGQGGTGGIGGAGGSGGGTGECTLDSDCSDGDVCTTDRCDAGTCSNVLRDDDGDAVVAVSCGGSDCNDLNPTVYPGAPEVCTDGADNDCNGVADCIDPACKGKECGCVSSGAEDCTNGLDEDCDTTVDCNDVDCVGTPACGCAAKETACDDGIDEDCDGAIDCVDTDCFATETCICQAQVEDCGDALDNDCDLLLDCADPNCKGVGQCACLPPGTPELCADLFDNDCDGKVDCADPECAANVACKKCTLENCGNGSDDDCDGKIDCADEACAFSPSCVPKQEVCNNNLDDDLDGKTDCNDGDCANNPLCQKETANCLTANLITQSGTFVGNTDGFVGQYMGACGGGAGEAVYRIQLDQPSRVHLDTKGTSFDSVIYVRQGSCEAGAEIKCDDDSGGDKWSAAVDFGLLYPGTYYVFVDGFTVDPNLGANDGPYVLHVEIEPNPKESSAGTCGDGKDNDGDFYIDCADTSCHGVPFCATCNEGGPGAPEFGVARCTNGKDDDCDGKTDADDTDCDASPYANPLEDCDGKDTNDNGIPDDFSCRCANDADCAGVPGFVCYTRTIHACGPRCFQFFGNVCPAIASGTYCNQTTGQCEY